MSSVLTLIANPAGPAIEDSMVATARAALASSGVEAAGDAEWLAPGIACDIAFTGPAPPEAQAAVREALAAAPVDAVIQPSHGRRKRLLVADMESTIIANEFIDEIAEAAGIGEVVAGITLRVVRGEVEFAAAIEERVAMFTGLPEEALERAWGNVAVMPGAEALARTMRAHGAHTALVSGGFTFFSERVAELVGFDSQHANLLETADGALTGRIVAPILDRAAKRTWLETIAGELGISCTATMAVGDGANDLDMLAAAGLGVAFRAKPIVARSAAARIDHGDLTALLYLQGYRAEEIVG